MGKYSFKTRGSSRMKKSSLVLLFSFLLIFGFFYFKNTKIKTTDRHKIEKTNTINLILSPHFDDAVLSLGGLMSTGGHNFLVATFFTKRPTIVMHTEWDRISGFKNSDEAILNRTKENENALMSSNAIIKNYDYPDFQYRTKKEDGEIEKNMAVDIEKLIRNYSNEEINIYGPATFGLQITHPDHQMVHDALIEASKKEKSKNIHFFIYEDFPYTYHYIISNGSNLNSYLEKIDNITLNENTIELDKAELSQKINNILKYKSQIKAFTSLGENLGILVEKFYKERCLSFLPKAYACEVVYSLQNN